MAEHIPLRKTIAPIIESAVSIIHKSEIKRIRAALRDAYPFQSKTGYEYKVWLSEVHRQLGFKLTKSNANPDQLELFE